MPVETVKCQECGSTDVSEFKPGSYVCGEGRQNPDHADQSRIER
jgi:hypothetical protein